MRRAGAIRLMLALGACYNLSCLVGCLFLTAACPADLLWIVAEPVGRLCLCAAHVASFLHHVLMLYRPRGRDVSDLCAVAILLDSSLVYMASTEDAEGETILVSFAWRAARVVHLVVYVVMLRMARLRAGRGRPTTHDGGCGPPSGAAIARCDAILAVDPYYAL